MPAWAWRARLGILVNHNDAVPETEFWAMAPRGVSVHAARFEGPRQKGQDYGPEAAAALAESADLARGIEFFSRMRLETIFLCFSTASILAPVGFDEDLTSRLTKMAGGIRVTTATEATVAAIAAIGLRRPMVVVPPWFSDALMSAADAYFRRQGLDVAAVHRVSLGRAWSALESFEIYDRGGQWEVTVEHVYRSVRATCPSSADGVVVIGNGLYCIDAIAPLEEDLGRPVLTANQVGMWYSLGIAGVGARIEGYGQLFKVKPKIEHVGGDA
jgi:maleate isomerase